jgi:hypothetical protein
MEGGESMTVRLSTRRGWIVLDALLAGFFSVKANGTVTATANWSANSVSPGNPTGLSIDVFNEDHTR